MRNVSGGRLYRVAGVLGFSFLFLGCSCSFPFLPDPPPKEEAWPSWAPDSRRLAYECYLEGPANHDSLLEPEGPHRSFYAAEAADICITNVEEHDQMHLISDVGGDWRPLWSPDSSRIAYLREDGIYLVTPEGRHRHQLVQLAVRTELGWSPEGGEGVDLTWSPQSDHLLFSGCLDHSDRDVYVVNANTGAVTNLTPDSRTHDFSPMWTFSGTKVVFLSAMSSSSHEPHPGCSLAYDAPIQLRLMDADGGSEDTVYSPDFYYMFVTVSNSGKALFVTNKTSKTAYEYSLPSTENGSMYRMDLIDGVVVEMITVEEGEEPIVILPSWSPNEEYVAYRSFTRLKILAIGRDETLGPLDLDSINTFTWSPDSQKIAVTVSKHEDYAIDSEEHIHVFDVQSRTFQPLILE